MSTFNLRPISDMGGKQILGMSGSLNGYIRTGNPFDKRFCHPDSVELSQQARTKRKTKDILTFAGIAGGIAGIFLLGKKGKLKGISTKVSEFFRSLKTKMKLAKKPSGKKIIDNIKKPFQSIKNAFGKISKK